MVKLCDRRTKLLYVARMGRLDPALYFPLTEYQRVMVTYCYSVSFKQWRLRKPNPLFDCTIIFGEPSFPSLHDQYRIDLVLQMYLIIQMVNELWKITFFCPRKSHTNPVLGSKKSNLVVRVISYKWQDYYSRFLSLIIIEHCYFNFR